MNEKYKDRLDRFVYGGLQFPDNRKAQRLFIGFQLVTNIESWATLIPTEAQRGGLTALAFAGSVAVNGMAVVHQSILQRQEQTMMSVPADEKDIDVNAALESDLDDDSAFRPPADWQPSERPANMNPVGDEWHTTTPDPIDQSGAV